MVPGPTEDHAVRQTSGLCAGVTVIERVDDVVRVCGRLVRPSFARGGPGGHVGGNGGGVGRDGGLGGGGVPVLLLRCAALMVAVVVTLAGKAARSHRMHRSV